MANIKSAKKRARQTTKRTARNVSVRSAMRSAIKLARESRVANDPKAQEVVKNAISQIMKAATKGILHVKTAARYVSRLSKSAQTPRAPQ